MSHCLPIEEMVVSYTYRFISLLVFGFLSEALSIEK